ncbi:ABATE domain-containing protein [Saccharopolyspora gregorii]|uniref:DUF222 domain-containing protein n=1 Tax=Saccharopolyspora gregorii TaxID=33914 RepID=A0ABP6S3B1_9PSEU
MKAIDACNIRASRGGTPDARWAHDPAIRTAVDLANTVKPITGADELETVAAARGLLDRHAPAAPGPRHPTHADLAEVRALRGTVRAVLERATHRRGGTRP